MPIGVPERHILGKVSDIPAGRAKSFRAAGRDLIVVNTGEGLRGYVNFCQHMGGKLRCAGEHLECDWHGARYACTTGEAIPDTAAPEGANLEKIELLVEGDDLIYIHTPKKSMWALE